MLARKPMIQQAEARPASIPAPVGGWNARDSLANMDQMDAVTLENMFPSPSSVTLRGGYTNFATGMSGQVQTLMNYAGASANKLFAIDAIGKSIYDVSAGGAVGGAVVTGLTNALWEYTNVSTPGGNFLYAANGVDKPLLYDGTNWVAIDSGSSPAISGVTTTTLTEPLLFKNRVWFIQKNTLTAWYLPTQAVGGAAQMLDLRSVAMKGGYLVTMDTWTIDAGYGLDDMLVFVTSLGEIIIYRGTDPASSATWALMGVWALGAPVTNRCTLKWGGDLLINTLDGLLPMAQALQSSRLDPRVALSDKIQNAISLASSNYGSSAGWQVFYFPRENAVWLNVPVGVGTQQQFVMNTITKSWCNFTGWAANCWCLYKDDPYFGGNGVVGKAWDTTSYADNSANINTSALQAFNYFEQRGIEKYFTRARPVLFSNGSPSIQIGMNVDFNIQTNVTPISYSAPPTALWGVSLWGVGLWGAGLTRVNNWQGITGIGYCGAIQFQSASMGVQIQWASTDVVYQAGWAGI